MGAGWASSCSTPGPAASAAGLPASSAGGGKPSEVDRVLIARHHLPGVLRLPPRPSGLLVFALGAGSSCRSPRNIRLAEDFCSSNFATLLFDLLDDEEALERGNVFDIAKLSSRLVEAVRWAEGDARVSHLPLALLSARTGAAAALRASVSLAGRVKAVVARRGRPDLVEDVLAQVRTPTLFVVGGKDIRSLQISRRACEQMRCKVDLQIVEGAASLFESAEIYRTTFDMMALWLHRELD
ncbi:alpha/beta hydrolase [Rhizobiales bacterium]|uniref:dienelactone hydrolase family protein n=1 Tax=Hongsoonwoonella zoysiae TaxID=2821844 RepID=UPI001561483F|nr:alpha/beta hydrolase [Hongsoonwoonella zoysiae]NRG16391.1 alpha/beta hydrolase [Hongsoonwoonella zoysiae]